MLVHGQLPPAAAAIEKYSVLIDARPCHELLTQAPERDAMRGVRLPARVTIALGSTPAAHRLSRRITLHASRSCLQIVRAEGRPAEAAAAAAADDPAAVPVAVPVHWRWSPEEHEDALELAWDRPLATLVIHYWLRLSTAPVGLYVSGRTKQHVWLSSQCEPVGARRIFPCADEPRWKVPIQLTVLAPKQWTVLSNTEGVRSRHRASDSEVSPAAVAHAAPVLHTLTTAIPFSSSALPADCHAFAPTPPMSTYLLALVLASPGALHRDDLHLRTQDGVRVRVWRHDGDDPSLCVVAATTAVGALHALQALTRLPYMLPKLDLVPVHAFDSAAMENWGCMLFHRDMLLTDVPKPKHSRADGGPDNDDDDDDQRGHGVPRRAVQVTVAHEVAHQWFGNLVTMRWWHDLWLNEAFATLVGYWVLALHELFDIRPGQVLPPPPDALWPAALSAGHLPSWQHFLLDELAEALRGRAVRCPEHTVVTEADIESMFDGVTYARGAAVLRTVFLALGPDAVPSIRLYLLRACMAKGLASMEHLWEAVGAPVARLGAAWLAADRLHTIDKSGRARNATAAVAQATGLPCLARARTQFALTPAEEEQRGGGANKPGFAMPVAMNPLFGVPALVPIGPGSLPAFKALLTPPNHRHRLSSGTGTGTGTGTSHVHGLDVAGAVCLLLSARAAVEHEGDPEGWAIVREAALGTLAPPPVARAAQAMLREWSAKCRALRSDHADPARVDSRMRALVAAKAAAAAAGSSPAEGKFALRSLLQTCVQSVIGPVDLEAWEELLERSLAVPIATRKAVLSLNEARDFMAALRMHVHASRHVCGKTDFIPLQQTHVARGGRRRAALKAFSSRRGLAKKTTKHNPLVRRCCGAQPKHG